MNLLRRLGIMKRRRRSSSDEKGKPPLNSRQAEILDETASNSSSPGDPAPWRVENILIAPAQEADWWEGGEFVQPNKEAPVTDSGDTAGTVETFGTCPNDYEGLKFRNHGFETWLMARQAWHRCCNYSPTESPQKSSVVVAKYPTPAMKRDLIKYLGNKNRQYSLPRRLPLSAVVEVYTTEIWTGSDASD